jgi:hypothetical protein
MKSKPWCHAHRDHRQLRIREEHLRELSGEPPLLPHLDLDSIVWEPGQVAVERLRREVLADLSAFMKEHRAWVIEGCYGELAEAALPYCSELVFLNPGLEACLKNNRRRAWEPHKYSTQQEQDAMLDKLQAWVAGYYQRSDAWSYAAHRALFDAFGGRKTEHTSPLE